MEVVIRRLRFFRRLKKDISWSTISKSAIPSMSEVESVSWEDNITFRQHLLYFWLPVPTEGYFYTLIYLKFKEY